MLDYFLILILSHLLTDFVFQTETLVSQKHSACKKEKQNALLAHSGIFFITSFVLFLVIEGIQLLSWSTLGIILLLTLSHYGLDLIKVKMETANQTLIAACKRQYQMYQKR
jgi:drug/metabolite transporter superfamily protein YnfA